MRFLGLIPTLAAVFAAGQASAHAFDAGADAYAQFVEGASVVLAYPSLLLPVLALGVLLALWDPDGLPRVWLLYVAGLVAGVFAGAWVGAWIEIALLALAVVTCSLAALLPRHTHAEAAGLAALTGLMVFAGSFEGHGLFELGPFIHLGIFFGANLALAAPAALLRLVLMQSSAPWINISVRVVASWIGAVAVLLFAFAVVGGGPSP